MVLHQAQTVDMLKQYLQEPNKNSCICKKPLLFCSSYLSDFYLAFSDQEEKSSYCLVTFPNIYRSLVVTFCLVDSGVCTAC